MRGFFALLGIVFLVLVVFVVGSMLVASLDSANADGVEPTQTPVMVMVTATPAVPQVPTTDQAATIPATAVPATVVPATAVPALMQGCAGHECVLKDFDPERTGINVTLSWPVYLADPQEMWTAGKDTNGEWTIWFGLPGCVTVLTAETAEHNTITFNTGVTQQEKAVARTIWAGQLLNAPNSPYKGATIMYCDSKEGYAP